MKQPKVKVTKKNGVSTAKTKTVKVLRINVFSESVETETEISFEWMQCEYDDEGQLPSCGLVIKEKGKRAAYYLLEPNDFAEIVKLSKLCPFKKAGKPA